MSTTPAVATCTYLILPPTREPGHRSCRAAFSIAIDDSAADDPQNTYASNDEGWSEDAKFQDKSLVDGRAEAVAADEEVDRAALHSIWAYIARLRQRCTGIDDSAAHAQDPQDSYMWDEEVASEEAESGDESSVDRSADAIAADGDLAAVYGVYVRMAWLRRRLQQAELGLSSMTGAKDMLQESVVRLCNRLTAYKAENAILSERVRGLEQQQQVLLMENPRQELQFVKEALIASQAKLEAIGRLLSPAA